MTKMPSNRRRNQRKKKPPLLDRERMEKALREIAALPVDTLIKHDGEGHNVERREHVAVKIAKQALEGSGPAATKLKHIDISNGISKQCNDCMLLSTKRMEQALRYLEWYERSELGHMFCPVCRKRKDRGHRPDCLIKQAFEGSGGD